MSREKIKKTIQKNCPACGEPIIFKNFTDPLSKKEFGISGLCQNCQNKTFK